VISLRVGDRDFSITNAVIYLALLLSFFGLVVHLAAFRGNAVIPGRYAALLYIYYVGIWNRVAENLKKHADYLFPRIFTLFSFLLRLNVFGLVPYSYTVTAHLIVTITLAFFVFFGKLLRGFRLHGRDFWGILLPGGAPRARVPFLVLIEFISYNITLISLSVRLFANRRAGHILLKVRGTFAWQRRSLNSFVRYIAHFLPLIVLTALFGLEFAVALIQAYVFSLLTCIYLSDVIEGGH
jgi:F-type H+-transporting ATPase subunit a